MRASKSLLLVMVAIGGLSCGSDSPAAPTPTPSPNSGISPGVASIVVSGDTSLTALGETSRLTATARFVDETTRDVTAEANWTSTKPNLLRVSAGVVTVVDYGAVSISATFGGRTHMVQATATPPDTFIFQGRAREPGASGLASVRVSEPISNKSVLTDSNGEFQLAALPAGRPLKFDKDGYENTEVKPQMTPGPIVWIESALQRVVRINAGQTTNVPQIAPHDVSYSIGSDFCYPCRLIRVSTSAPGTLRVTATWSGTPSLGMWVHSSRVATPKASPLTADIPVAAGEIPVYVGWLLPQGSSGASTYVAVTLATSVVGP